MERKEAPNQSQSGNEDWSESEERHDHKTATTSSAAFEDELKREIAKRDFKIVFVVRLLFAAVLVGSAVGVSLIVFYYTRNTEDREFETQFKSDADKILQSIGDAFDATLATADNFAAMTVAQKGAANTTFPFVAVPNYAIQAAKAKTLSKAFVVGTSYMISEEDREAWEVFASENNQFVQEAWELQKQDESYQGSLETYPNIQDEIFANFPEFSIRPHGSGPYVVTWQNYPVIYEENSAPYNYDINAIPFIANRWYTAYNERRPIISTFSGVVDPRDPTTNPVDMISVNFAKNFIPPTENAAEPMVNLLYPIIDQKEKLRIDDDSDAPVVGMWICTIFWREMLRNILPDTSKGILVMTENSCGQNFTYEINVS